MNENVEVQKGVKTKKKHGDSPRTVLSMKEHEKYKRFLTSIVLDDVGYPHIEVLKSSRWTADSVQNITSDISAHLIDAGTDRPHHTP